MAELRQVGSAVSKNEYSVRKLRDSNELHALLKDHQPRSALCLAVALERGLNRRTRRCVTVHDRSGKLAGAVVLHRWLLDRWLALPVLIDPDAAQVLGHLIDRGPADGVHAPATDAARIGEHMTRVRGSIHERGAASDYPTLWEEPDPRCRWSTEADNDVLEDLYWNSELNFLPSRRVLRRLRRRNPEPIMVFDPGDGHGPVALFMTFGRTPEWDISGDLIVHPAHRGQGISWALAGFAVAEANKRGVGYLALLRDSNPMAMPVDALDVDDFAFLELHSPRRFKGEPRLHRLGYHLTTWDKQRPQARSFSHDRVDRDRRTQQAWRDKLIRDED